MNATPVRIGSKEGELLTIARAIVTPNGYASVEAKLASERAVSSLRPAAMRVLEDILAKGVTKTLARLGGARPRVRADTGSPSLARVFDVRRAPVLTFGTYTFELLRWLTNAPLGARGMPSFEQTPRTLGDELFAYLVLRLVEGQRLERFVASAPALSTPLTWIGFARMLARHGGEGRTVAPMKELLASDDAKIVVECLAADLAERWRRSTEWNDGDVLHAEDAVRIADLERSAIDHYLDAVDVSGRWDLATFLIDAASRALPKGAKASDIAARAAPRVRAEGTLRARTESRQRAGALFHALGRLRKKRDELVHVHFVDEGYDVAQATLTSWEILGPEAFTRAESVLSVLSSLGDTTLASGKELGKDTDQGAS